MFALRGEQIRAARALKRWSRKKLAQEASRFHSVSEETIRDWEGVDGVINATTARVDAVRRAFDDAGVELLNHGSPGARLRAVPTADS